MKKSKEHLSSLEDSINDGLTAAIKISKQSWTLPSAAIDMINHTKPYC